MQKKKVKLIINPLATLPPHFIQSKTNGFYSLHVLFISCLFTMQTKMLMRIVLFWLISNCSHLKSSLIYYIFSEVFDGCCQESEPHIYQQRSLLLEKWRPDMNFFFKYINFFSGELIQGQTIEWKRNFSFWGELLWLRHFSRMDIKFLSHEHPSLSPPSPAPHQPPPLLMHPRHKLRADIGLSIGGVE